MHKMYCLSWDSHKSNICNGFAQLQQREEFVDMTLVAEGHLVKVHKNLISLASPYIKNVIKAVPCIHPIVFLPNISHEVLSLLLEYIYTGEVHVELEKLNDFVKAAKELQLPSITNEFPQAAALSKEQSNNTQKPVPVGKEINIIENRILECGTRTNDDAIEANGINIDIDMALSENANNDHSLPFATSVMNEQNTNTPEAPPKAADIQLLESGLLDYGTTDAVIDAKSMNDIIDSNFTSLKNYDDNHYDYSHAETAQEVDEDNNFDEFLKFRDPPNSTGPVKDNSVTLQNTELEVMDVKENSVTSQQNSLLKAVAIKDNSVTRHLNRELEVDSIHNEANIEFSFDVDNDIMPQQYTISKRGSLQMILHRYLYNMQFSANGGVKRRWRCIDYRLLHCGAYVDTLNDNITKRKNSHTHPFHDSQIMKKLKANTIFGTICTAVHETKKKNNMKYAVKTTDC